jgi:predicted MFS family arabinose efflux permease
VASLSLYAAVVLAMHRFEPSYLAAYGAVFGLAHGFFFPAYTALIVENALPVERGKLMALCNGGFNAGYALGGVVFGALAEHFGYPSLFLAAGLSTVAAVGLLLAGPRGAAPAVVHGGAITDWTAKTG